MLSEFYLVQCDSVTFQMNLLTVLTKSTSVVAGGNEIKYPRGEISRIRALVGELAFY